jgi:hypothetical protein
LVGARVATDRCLRRLPVKSAALNRTTRSKASASFGYVVPIAFVLCWASGFVVPRAFQPYSEPLIFVTLRNAGAFAVLALIALSLRAPWPRTRADYFGLARSGALLPTQNRSDLLPGFTRRGLIVGACTSLICVPDRQKVSAMNGVPWDAASVISAKDLMKILEPNWRNCPAIQAIPCMAETGWT